MAVSHVFTSPIADVTGTATVWNGTTTATVAASEIVKPSNWNSVHNQFMTLSGNTAGASTVSGTNIVFQGGNNVTLSGNGSTVIFSGPTAAGTGTTIAATNVNVSATLNTAGLNLAVSAPFISSAHNLWPVSTALQTLASASGQSSSGSMVLVPFTVVDPLYFTRIDMAHQLSYVTSGTPGAVSNTYKMMWGLYSMNNNTLSLMSSSSFSIEETNQSVSLTWNMPTTTASDSSGYGSFPAGNLTTTAQISSYVSGYRQIGHIFGNSVTLSPGVYWFGLMSGRTTAGASTQGLSHVGVMANVEALFIMNRTSNSTAGGVMVPMGVAMSAWTTAASDVTGWNGRPIMGFLTATSVTDYGGTAVPQAISLTRLAPVAANSTMTVMPLMSFYG